MIIWLFAHISIRSLLESRMEGQVVKKQKLMSEYEKQLYDRAKNNIQAAIQGEIAKT